MSGENISDQKFWKNMKIMFMAKAAILTVSIIAVVGYNSQFYA